MRERLLEELDLDVKKLEQQGFDLDGITEDAWLENMRWEPLYDLETLERVLTDQTLLPNGTMVQKLGEDYAYRSWPYMEQIRVTTNANFFDRHPENTELWSPGSPSFPQFSENLGLLSPEELKELFANGLKLKDIL